MRNDDTLSMYMAEVKRHPLLKREEEVALATIIRKGGPAAERARERFANANLRLVVKAAFRHMGRGLDVVDLVQEGNMGLLKAIEKFDPTLGYKFSTYATWWIRQSMTRALADTGTTIRLPVHLREKINVLHKIVSTLAKRGEEITDEAVAREFLKRQAETPAAAEDDGALGGEDDIAAEDSETSTDADVAEDGADSDELADAGGKDLAAAIKMVRKLAGYAMVPHLSSLDETVGEDGDTPRGALIPGPEHLRPDVIVESELADEQVRSLLSCLTEREADVIKLRFGIQRGDDDKTLEEVGQKYGVTRERIRQIEAKALDKLRLRARSSRMVAGLAAVIGAKELPMPTKPVSFGKKAATTGGVVAERARVLATGVRLTEAAATVPVPAVRPAKPVAAAASATRALAAPAARPEPAHAAAPAPRPAREPAVRKPRYQGGELFDGLADEQLSALLAALPAGQAEVLKHSYGLLGCEANPTGLVAQKVGLALKSVENYRSMALKSVRRFLSEGLPEKTPAAQGDTTAPVQKTDKRKAKKIANPFAGMDGEQVAQHLSRLTARQAQVLTLLFGLDGSDGLSASLVAARLGVSTVSVYLTVKRAVAAVARPAPAPKVAAPPKAPTRSGRKLELADNPIAGVEFSVLAERLHRALTERRLHAHPVERLAAALSCLELTERELVVFSLVWGLHGGRPQKDLQIARFFGVSRSIVGRWRNSAQAKIAKKLAG